MRSDAEPLPGHEHILTGLIPEVLWCDGEARNRDLPVTLLLGPRGSGKTATLEELEREYDSPIPCANLDLEGIEEEQARGILMELAHRLGRRSLLRGQLFRVRFPLLTVCLFAAGAQVELRDDPQITRTQLREALQRSRKQARRKVDVKRLLEIVRMAVNPPDWFNPAMSLLLPGLRAASDRWLLHRWQRWLRTDNRPWAQGGDPFDAMIYINRQSRGDAHARPRIDIDALLFEAFLADLHWSLNGPLTTYDRMRKYLVLLDNAHSPGGEHFLDLLVDARHARAERHPGAGDPLAVVATSRRLLRQALDDTDGGRIRAIEEASYGDWSSLRDRPCRRHRSWWYPVTLRDLTISEVAGRIRAKGLTELAYLTEFVHWLTQGHPEATDVVLDAIWAQGEPESLAGRRVLELSRDQGRRKPSVTVAAHLMERLLQEASGDVRGAMVAAAVLDVSTPTTPETLGVNEALCNVMRIAIVDNQWNVDVASALHPTLRMLLPAIQERVEAVVRQRLSRDDPQQLVLHPLLRRLLQQSLAAETDGDPREAHNRLACYHREREERVQQAHHQLALEDVSAAAWYLLGRFGEVDVESWIIDLTLITAAPNYLGPGLSAVPSLDLHKQLIPDMGTGDRLTEVVAGLVPALWVLADPLGGPTHIGARREDLHSRVGDLYDELVPFAGSRSDRFLLRDMARRYQQIPLPWRAPDNPRRRSL